MLEFEILGPLAVRSEQGDIRVAGALRRALLVRLLVTANELVPASRLADDLWAGQPPTAATSTLQSHISLLRKVLGPGRLIGRDGGYVLELADQELDARRFEDESRRGRSALAAGAAAEASSLLGAALSRWRGTALADVSGASWALSEETRLEGLRLGAIESWFEARLQLGEHQEVASLAEAAVVEHPLREEIWGYLMLSLYRSGRQSDALRAYQRLRHVLGDELGIEPSARLIALDDAIVQQKPELDWVGSGGAGPGAETWRRQAESIGRRSADGPILPSGTVSLLAAEVEASTRQWEDHPKEMASTLIRYEELLRSAVAEENGYVIKSDGDAIRAAFVTPQQAVAAAVTAQRCIGAEPWPAMTPIRVRMGLHAGVCHERNGEYFGPTVTRVSRLMDTAHGGQIVTSSVFGELLGDGPPDGTSLFDLGEHTLKDLTRPEHVFQVLARGLEREFPPLRSQTMSERRHNLPAELSSFIGRTAQLAEIRGQLDRSRLVTLTGPGGAGKTRLALQVGAELVDVCPDGVWFVDLSPISDHEMVARAVAGVLLLREEPDRPLAQTLASALVDQRLTLVFDNCEQVLDAAARLAGQLLARCPDLTILATSREPLGISSESTIRVSSMTVPPDDLVDPAILEDFESTRLFIERANDHQRHFRLDESNAAAVASICRRLDGIPLAIELAAGRVRSLTPHEIDARLEDRFRLLTGGNRAGAPRHQTLRAAIEWSFNLLTPTEQVALTRLSVFSGGWTVDAGEAVVVSSGDVESWEVLDLLSALVDKSLIHADSSGTVSRFGMLESVHRFATDQLGTHGNAHLVGDAHASFFLALAETAATHWHDPDQSKWLEHVERDHDNFRISLKRLTAGPADTERALRLGIALHMFWLGRGYIKEGIDALEAILGDPETQALPKLRGGALYALGHMLVRQGSHDAARSKLTEALAIARRSQDSPLEAAVLATQVWLEFSRGADATALANEAVLVARHCAVPRLTAVALERRADIVSIENVDGARADYAEALSLFRLIGDVPSAGEVLSNLSVLELEAGDLDAAKANLDMALEILVESNRVDALPAAYVNLGLISILKEDFAHAQTPFTDALVAARRMGMKVVVGYALMGLALCATGLSDYDRGATLHGAADALFEQCGESVQSLEEAIRRADHERLRDSMSAATFALAYNRGRSLTLADAVQAGLGAAVGLA